MEQSIIQIVAEIKNDNELCSILNQDSNLTEDVGFDSLEMINFILLLEDTFQVEIDFETFDFSLLSSVSLLGNYLKSLDGYMQV